MEFKSMEEFRNYYFPKDQKKRKALEEQGICPECRGSGKKDNTQWRKNEGTKTKQA